MTQREKDAIKSLHKYGYTIKTSRQRVEVWSNGIKGFTSSRLIRTSRTLHDAIEQMVPIIRDDEFLQDIQSLGFAI